MDAVGAASDIAGAGDDAESGWFAVFAGVDLPGESEQRGCGLVDEFLESALT